MCLTLAEARERAATISDVSYAIDLDLTSTQAFRSRTTVRFRTTSPTTFLELKGDRSPAVLVDGARVDADYDGVRLALRGLPTDRAVEVVVDAELPYVTDGDGMHVFTDPADGERYVSAYVGMDIAQKVFACFDQNDLKAPLTLTVAADPADTVLANGATISQDAGRWRFATTQPVPVALFIVAAGPWHSVRWEYAGLPFGWHARRSLGAELDRDAEELRRTTEACFDHYAEIFTEPYLFDSYDQIFVPGLNWGAQEMPGCVTYRDELLPRGAITDTERSDRAVIIAHEMSHMWFGDSMTMTWWEDTWLQESFADYMGYRVAEAGAGFRDLLVEVEVGRKPWGYASDSRRSTHPVAPLADDVPDVDTAATIFDGISYAKGGACLRQLAFWLGDAEFLAGVNAHLSRFRLANATLDDFVESLAAVSSRDVRGWVDVWLRRAGHDTITVTRDGDVPVVRSEGVRPHAMTVAAFDDALAPVGTTRIELDEGEVALPQYADLIVVPNAGGETFAHLRLDPESWAAVSSGLARIADPLVRAVLWSNAFRLVRTRELSPDAYLRLLERHLPSETEPTVIEAVLRQTLRIIVPTRVPAGEASDVVSRIAATAAAGLAAGGDSASAEQRALAWAATLAVTAADPGLLRSWLDADSADGMPLLPSTRWSAIVRLAELGAADEAFIEAERERDGTQQGDLGAARALAARPLAEAKAAAWARMTGEDQIPNRLFGALADGLWVPEQAALLGPYVSAYAETAPRLAARGQAFAGTVGFAFPSIWLSADQLASFDAALAGEVPVVLRRSWEDHLDDRRSS